jgi:1-deoxy-D-xylulose-5-phosphate reductoisomerase
MITVNSATLMNKGLEVIEAHLLFGVPYDRIEVVVHPQSIVHAMVEWCDGSTVAQLSMPDMRLPIALALGWPQRCGPAYGRIDWATARQLTFEPVDTETFTLLDVAVGAGRTGGIAPAVLNAANEEAVDAFLGGRLSFPGITEVVVAVLDELTGGDRPAAPPDLETVLAAERSSRALARTLVEERPGTRRTPEQSTHTRPASAAPHATPAGAADTGPPPGARP